MTITIYGPMGNFPSSPCREARHIENRWHMDATGRTVSGPLGIVGRGKAIESVLPNTLSPVHPPNWKCGHIRRR